MNAATADPCIAQLTEMADCAYRLGMAFGREAEQAASRKERIELFRLFDRCFFSLRVSAALKLRLMRALRAPAKEPLAAEREEADLEDADWEEEPDWEEAPERERDRETERASFPILIRTLQGVAAEAEGLPGPKPAELLTLRELLARVKSAPPASGAAPAAAPKGLRTRLAASGVSIAATLDRSLVKSQPSTPPPRRATGPPGR